MNHWAFVTAAYALTGLGLSGLIGWAWLGMRQTERRLADLVER